MRRPRHGEDGPSPAPAVCSAPPPAPPAIAMVRVTPKLPRLRCSSQMLLAGIKEYLQESSLHGLRYLADPGRHWSERLFWTIVCVASLIGTYFLLMSSWNAFQYHAVSFVSETAYLDWNTTFPAVSVCETESPDKLYESATKVFGVTRNRNLDFFLRDIVFFDGTCRSCSTQCGPVMNCTDDFLSIIERVRSNCSSLINNCRWNGELFDCCKNFLPLQTETGLCYAINSLHNRYFPNGSRVNNQLVDLISNRRTGPGTLDFMAKESIKIFIHAPEDVPNFNHPQDEKESLFWGLNFHMRFAVTEIENDPQLLDVSVAQRNCRFPHESPLTLHDKYSYSTCIVECHAKYQMQFCNCTHHYMPNMHNLTTKTCGVEGLACLNLHSETLRSLKTSWSTKPGLACDCVSSCTEPEYSVVWKSSQGNDAEGDADHDQGTRVRLMLDSLPTTRFRRNVVRTRLDLVVSMGGTAGLFLGASLLTLVELVYYACRTPSFKLLQSQQGRQSSSQSKKSTPPPSLPAPPSGGTPSGPTGPTAADAWRRLRLRHDYGGSPMVRRVQPALPTGPMANLEDGAGYYKLPSGNAKVERSAYKNNLRQYSDAFDLYM